MMMKLKYYKQSQFSTANYTFLKQKLCILGGLLPPWGICWANLANVQTLLPFSISSM